MTVIMKNEMKMKKQYEKPLCGVMSVNHENILYTASPGVGGGYEEGMPIEAKESFFEEESEIRYSLPGIDYNVWDEEFRDI